MRHARSGGSRSQGFREPRATPACDRGVDQFRNRRAIFSKGTPFVSGTIVSTQTSCRPIIPQKKANTAFDGKRTTRSGGMETIFGGIA